MFTENELLQELNILGLKFIFKFLLYWFNLNATMIIKFLVILICIWNFWSPYQIPIWTYNLHFEFIGPFNKYCNSFHRNIQIFSFVEVTKS